MQLKLELQQKGWAQFLFKGKSSIFQYHYKIRYFYCWVRNPRVKDLIPRSALLHILQRRVHNTALGTKAWGPSGAPGTSLAASLLQDSPGLQGWPLATPGRGLQEPWTSRDPLPQAAPRGALFTLVISEGGVLIALNYRWKNWSGQQSIRLIYHPVPTRGEPAISCRHEIYY